MVALNKGSFHRATPPRIFKYWKIIPYSQLVLRILNCIVILSGKVAGRPKDFTRCGVYIVWCSESFINGYCSKSPVFFYCKNPCYTNCRSGMIYFIEFPNVFYRTANLLLISRLPLTHLHFRRFQSAHLTFD